MPLRIATVLKFADSRLPAYALRFYPDGSMLFRTTPQTVRQVARSLQRPPRAAAAAAAADAASAPDGPLTLMRGRYKLRGTTVLTASAYTTNPRSEVLGTAWP